MLKIDLPKLRADLEELGKITAAGAGVTRVAFSPEDLEGRRRLATKMAALGMTVETDGIGNQIGRLPGTEPGLKPLALGSHSDSVPNGGLFDGALGLMAALACVRSLQAAGRTLRHPLELINFAAEEALVGGGTLGSRAMAGLVAEEVMAQKASDGRTVADHLAAAGFDFATVQKAARPAGSLAAYLELHIEQGAVLEKAGVPIGIVEGIVGIRRFAVRFLGAANHAGTTPMDQRADALVMAAFFILGVREAAVANGTVGTVGVIRVEPGAPNVIPGACEVQLEIRGLSPAVLDRVEQTLARCAAAAGPCEFRRTGAKPHADSDPRLLTEIAEACREVGVPSRPMVSGAGHDAMCMAALAPQAMLFVPSRGGISHSPDEWTDWEDCGTGAQVLLATLLRLDATDI